MVTITRWTGREAAALRKARRMSIRSYACHLGVSPASISNWERRGTNISLRSETQQLLDTDLENISGDVQRRFAAVLAEYYQPHGTIESVSSETPPHIPDLHPATDLVDMAPISWLSMFENLTAEASTLGWVTLHPIVSAYLHSLDLVRAHGSTSRNVAVTDARFSEFMSWVCDNGGFGEGERWLSRAYKRAREADDDVLAAYVLMRQSQRALDNGDAGMAVKHSQQALAVRNLPPRTQALCLTRLAEGIALSGSERESIERIVAARRLVSLIDDQTSDPLARHCDDRYVEAAEARCRYLLGDSGISIVMLEDVLANKLPADAVDSGMWQVHLADCYASSAPENAAQSGLSALRLAQASGSKRITKALLPLAVMLRQRRHHPFAAQFLSEHHQLLTEPMPR